MNFDYGKLIEAYDNNAASREAVAHNVGVLRCIRGGLRMAERYRVPFDPRFDYWRRPERRFVVAYLAQNWTGRFAPAVQLRRLAIDLLQHADRARRDGLVTFRGIRYELAGGLGSLCETLAQHVETLPASPAWEALRDTWPKLAPTAAEDVAAFLRSLPENEGWEPGFARRLPWLGYLDAADEAALRARQAYFFAFANLWTMSNAYRRAGAQAFAPVLQNTKSDLLLDKALQWAKGQTPVETGFETIARDDADEAPQDRATYAAVVEVYGFLNLHRAPFYNNLAEVYRTWFAIPANVDAYELTARVGTSTATWLAEHPGAVPDLAARLRHWLDAPLHTRVQLESVESPRVRKTHAAQTSALLDVSLTEELARYAHEALTSIPDVDAAASALHLLLDAKLYTGKDVVVVVNGRENGTKGGGSVTPPAPTAEGRVLSLPDTLRPMGERALAYLRAGLHVLLAGAPGTGKTTLAQFVGYAWDRNLSELPASIPISEAPLTTVGNSAWSPFHTVGGLVPDGKDAFKVHGGVFIDPNSTDGDTWRLRSGAIVLDEMNRADLDRCIGDLYPLLSGSVTQVVPAGLPGVSRIVGNPRFRVIATVNDSNLDDIVFPISEGLARRFQRIEMQGGTREDVLSFLGITEPGAVNGPRQQAAVEAVDAFLEVAREHHLLTSDDLGDRLHFGVAYFELLRSWVDGRLQAPVLDAPYSEQARDFLASSLTTLGRAPRWREALKAFTAKA
ncbi:hypothetical protein TBR22_A06100 [Luteitalea sp. TBR-22]|uniref:AAA family ATPase n=1 Tax=Luteitalea sp. TBR-22 TaxID=2802971 RepID=UPI001AF06BA2|nr:AAA family ATPase [Luteitalea sp. TBR-22]BCS31409.1 hypothetical protein TBR22_A06100 [Luteitalea sp. TBR-22]